MHIETTTYMPGEADRADRPRTERQRGGERAGPHEPLAELRQLTDYTIADGDPDIRGWRVRTAAGLGDRTVGTVEDLIVDLDTLKVRYLLVCLDKHAVATSRDRRILVPIGVGRLDPRENEVRLDGFTSGQLVGIPEFRPGKLTKYYEMTVRCRFSSPAQERGRRTSSTAGFYEHSLFDDRYFWGAHRRGREDAAYLSRHG